MTYCAFSLGVQRKGNYGIELRGYIFGDGIEGDRGVTFSFSVGIEGGYTRCVLDDIKCTSMRWGEESKARAYSGGWYYVILAALGYSGRVPDRTEEGRTDRVRGSRRRDGNAVRMSCMYVSRLVVSVRFNSVVDVSRRRGIC